VSFWAQSPKAARAAIGLAERAAGANVALREASVSAKQSMTYCNMQPVNAAFWPFPGRVDNL
jgi:hypothetical protein